jgi:MFS family permease
MSEVLGRRKLFIGTYILFTIFNGGVIASQNVWTLIILRFLAGTAGSSPLTNAGGTVSDVFDAGQRGLGMAIFAAAPFLGPAVGPIVRAPHKPTRSFILMIRLVVSSENPEVGDG